VGNTQEATWRAEYERFLLTLLISARDDGRMLGRQFLPHDGKWQFQAVPYLGDADFGEFDLFQLRRETRQPVLPVTVSVQMEMQSRIRVPFGEARVFTLRAP